MKQALGITVLVLALLPGGLRAQEEADGVTIELEDGTVLLVNETAGVAVLRGYGRYVNRQVDQPRLTWYMVQDSSLGAVFTEPSGLKEAMDDDINGDFDLRFLDSLSAIEVRSLAFDAWNNFVSTYEATYVRLLKKGDKEGFDPGWTDYRGKSDELWTTITYVHRVRLADGTVKTANLEPVMELAKTIDPELEAEALDAEELRDLLRELFRWMGGRGAPVTHASPDQRQGGKVDGESFSRLAEFLSYASTFLN